MGRSVNALRGPAAEDPEVARKILPCLGLPARGPPVAAPRCSSADPGPESWDDELLWDFDQTLPGG
jgi:hypothetical protein